MTRIVREDHRDDPVEASGFYAHPLMIAVGVAFDPDHGQMPSKAALRQRRDKAIALYLCVHIPDVGHATAAVEIDDAMLDAFTAARDERDQLNAGPVQ